MNVHKKELSKEISDSRLETILGLFEEIRLVPTSKLELNLERTNKISASGLALLSCLADKCDEQNIDVQIVINNELVLFEHLEKIFKKKAGGFKSIDCFRYENHITMVWGSEDALLALFLEQMDTKFSGRVSEKKLWYARLILNELMQNAVDHSTSERYFVYCGIDNQDFIFGVCDRGVSIPAKLEQKYVCENDAQYLEKAMEYEVGTRRVRRGGLGLHHMFEILKEEKGRLLIIGRHGQVRRRFDRREVLSKIIDPPYYGTLCMTRIPLEEK